MPTKSLISFEKISEEHPYFLDREEHVRWNEVFQNDHPLHLEIGFGTGNFIIEMAVRQPENNFIGMDFYHKGIRKAISRIDKLLLQNIRIIYGDAKEKVPMIFADGELSEVYVNFPDPWPKKKHTKRRLLKPSFVQLLAQKLTQGGKVHIATDSKPYGDEILVNMDSEPLLENLAGNSKFSSSRDDIPKTKYEKAFMKAGETIYYMDFIKR